MQSCSVFSLLSGNRKILIKVCMNNGQLDSPAPLGEHLKAQLPLALQTPPGLVNPLSLSAWSHLWYTSFTRHRECYSTLMHYCMSCMVTGLVCMLEATVKTCKTPSFHRDVRIFLTSYFVPTIYAKRVWSVNKISRPDSDSHVVVGLLSCIYWIHHVLPLALPEENPKPTGVSRIFPLISTTAKMSSLVRDSKKDQLCQTLEPDQPERGKRPQGSYWDRRQSPSWGVQAPLALCCFPPRQHALGCCCGQCRICHQSHKKTMCILEEMIVY